MKATLTIIEKINNTKTIQELDDLRLEVVENMANGDFEEIQKAFVKHKNKLRRHGNRLE